MEKSLTKIGIDCEPIEDDTWGIAQIITHILAEIDRRPELASEFKFYLYFKSKIPDHPFLANSIFVKQIVRLPPLPVSFSIYYYVLLPIKKLLDGVNVMFYANYMLPLIHVGKSLVLSAHDAYYEARNKNIAFRYRIAYRIFATWAAWRATKVEAMSEFGKQELIKVFGISTDRIVVNHLGIDPAPTVQPYAPGRPYFLFVGQAFPRRHLRETLLAFEQIAPKYQNLDFRVVGVDKYTPAIIDQLVRDINNRLGGERIIWRQRVPAAELAALYAGARGVTYISDKEAFGLPPLEALAHGSVSIVADNDLSHELFGASAFFVPQPSHVESIAQTLTDVLENDAHRMEILNNRQQIINRFTWQAHTDRFLNIIKNLAHA